MDLQGEKKDEKHTEKTVEKEAKDERCLLTLVAPWCSGYR